ncbi:hypothetical protein, partial [Zoogloea sp.]|uniref:hypothetical protein n=1 Tax=Zoogloea sp. TaxID=49181 RepID=UPI002C25B3F3
MKPGRLLCFLSWRDKKGSRPPGANSPANVSPGNGKPISQGTPPLGEQRNPESKGHHTMILTQEQEMIRDS